MTSKTYRVPLLAFCTVSLLIGVVSTSQANTQNSLSFENWVERLRNQAFAKGISVNTLENAFSQNKQMDLPKESVQNSLASVQSTLQSKLTFSKLLRKQYGDALFEIKHLFGVDIDVIIAIASIENEITESYPAIDILINQSFKQPRNIVLQNELLQALKIIDEGQINAQQLKSDFQGNLGRTHFKPSVFRDYAIDYDGDGRFDLWQSYPDIFASTANYLNKMGWQTGKNWGIEVGLPEGFDPTLININQQKSLNKWQEMGIFQADGNELPTSSNLGSLIQIDNDKYYIVLDNYFALLRWKRSAEHAYTVGRLIDLL